MSDIERGADAGAVSVRLPEDGGMRSVDGTGELPILASARRMAPGDRSMSHGSGPMRAGRRHYDGASPIWGLLALVVAGAAGVAVSFAACAPGDTIETRMRNGARLLHGERTVMREGVSPLDEVSERLGVTAPASLSRAPWDDGSGGSRTYSESLGGIPVTNALSSAYVTVSPEFEVLKSTAIPSSKLSGVSTKPDVTEDGAKEAACGYLGSLTWTDDGQPYDPETEFGGEASATATLCVYSYDSPRLAYVVAVGDDVDVAPATIGGSGRFAVVIDAHDGGVVMAKDRLHPGARSHVTEEAQATGTEDDGRDG